MVWLLIAVVFFMLWSAELIFGWLLGGHLRGLIMLTALIYFGFTINKLKTAQTELQEELKRLWKTVKASQAYQTAPPEGTQGEQATPFNEAVDANVPVRENPREDIDAANWEESDPLNHPSSEPVFQTQAGSIDSAAKPAQAEHTQKTYADEWSRPDYYPEPDRPPNALEEWLAGGNWIVRGGLAILFLGLVFLAKFAYENALLPLELRLTAIAAFAVALLIIGWRSRLTRPSYGLSLQGGGVAVLYLTLFATSKLTDLLPSFPALALMLLVAVLAAGLAILQDAMVLAVIGTIGGFMAPVLMSTGHGSHIALFSYFAALDAGILAVALKKAWRPLNLLAFFFTFGIAGLWGMQNYRPEHQFSCLLFLALFFCLFITVNLLFTRHRSVANDYNRTVDASLLFGLPTVTFGYGLYLLKPYEYGGAWLAVLLSAIYLSFAFLANKRDNLAQLKMPWASLSLVFATLAVPLAFDARLTSSIWALEGAAVISYGWRQMQLKARLFGYLLVLLGTVGFYRNWPDLGGTVPVFNTSTMGLLVLIAAYGVSGAAVNHEKNQLPNLSYSYEECREEALSVSWVMALTIAFTGALVIFTELYSRNSAAVAGMAAPALLWLWALMLQRLGNFGSWPQINGPTIVLPLLTLLLPIRHSWSEEGLTGQGMVYNASALILILIWQAIAMRKVLPDLEPLLPGKSLPSLIHALPGLTVVVFWWSLLVRGRNTWSSALLPESDITMHGWFIPLAAAVPVGLLWWLTPSSSPEEREFSPPLWRWLHGDDTLPEKVANKQLKVFAFLAVAFILAATLFHSGRTIGLAYVPFLNLYELIAIAGLFALLKLFRRSLIGARLLGEESRLKWLAALSFLFANSILSRILVNYFGADFDMGFAWHSAIAATAYSIVWTLVALTAMWLASRRAARGLWIAGAVLLGIVALKLLMIDLSKVGSLARIISFIGVGVLMLIVGYIAPIPSGESGRKVNI